MAITYTTKLNLAKPAHGDVDWHMPNNENWDSIDSKLGPLYENIEVGTSEITIDKKVVVDEITSTKVKLFPSSVVKTERASYTGSMSSKGTITLGTFTVPSEYIEGSILQFEGWVQLNRLESYTATATLTVTINSYTVKSYDAYLYGSDPASIKKVDFNNYITITGNDVVSVILSGYPLGSQYDIAGASGAITFYGEDVIPFTSPHPTWS